LGCPFARTWLPFGFEEPVRRTTETLKQEGFGIITEIDVKEALQKKIGIAFRKYRILGECNPALAHEVLNLEVRVEPCFPAM